MTPIIILARLVAIAAGGFLLYTISETTIEATAATGASVLKIQALAAGVFVTSAIVGLAWASKRYPVAIFLSLCLFAGEGYNFLKTADRELSAKEAAQSAVNTAIATRETLKTNVTKAETAKLAADDAVRVENKTANCKKDCIASNNAAALRADAALTAARNELAASVIPASATPLADRSGYAAWTLDLIAAGLGSLALNGLAAGLIAFGAKVEPTQTRKENLQVDAEPARELPRIMVSDEPAPMAITPANDVSGQSDFAAVSEFDLAKVAAMFRGDVEPDGNGGPNGGARIIRPRRWQRDEVRADLTERLANGDKFPSQRAMAEMYGVPASTLCNWFEAWANEGQAVKRQQIGRRNAVG